MSLLEEFENAYRFNNFDDIEQIIEQADDLHYLFEYAYNNNYIDIIKLIYEKQSTIITLEYEIKACRSGNLDMLECLHELNPITQDLQDILFMVACTNNQLEIVKWMYELPNFDYKVFNNGLIRSNLSDNKKIISWILTTYPLIEI